METSNHSNFNKRPHPNSFQKELSDHICSIQTNQYLTCVLCDECFPIILKETHFQNVHPKHKFRNCEYRVISRNECCWCPKPNSHQFTVGLRLVEISYYKCSLCNRNDIKYRHRFAHQKQDHPDSSEIKFKQNFQFRFKCNKCYTLFRKANYNHKCEDVKYLKNKKIENWRVPSNIKNLEVRNNWRDDISNWKGFDVILAV